MPAARNLHSSPHLIQSQPGSKLLRIWFMRQIKKRMAVAASLRDLAMSYLRLPIRFAPLREMYSSLGGISRKGAKAYLSRKENQIDTTFQCIWSLSMVALRSNDELERS